MDKLFVKIPKEYKEEFERDTSLYNIKNVTQFSKAILIIEIIAIIMSYIPILEPFYGASLKYYRGMYFLLIAIVMIYMFIFRAIDKQIIKELRTLQYIELSCNLIGLFLGGYINIRSNLL